MANKNKFVLGNDALPKLCELLNIEFENETVYRLVIDASIDDVVKVEKHCIPRDRPNNDCDRNQGMPKPPKPPRPPG